MSQIHIHIDRLIDRVIVNATGGESTLEAQITDTLSRCLAGAVHGTVEQKVPPHESQISLLATNSNIPIKEWAETVAGDNFEIPAYHVQILPPGIDVETVRQAQEAYLKTVYGSAVTVKAVMVPLLIPVISGSTRSAKSKLDS